MLKVLSSVSKLIQFSSQEAIARLLLVSSWFVYSSKNLICLEVLPFYDSKSIGFLSSFYDSKRSTGEVSFSISVVRLNLKELFLKFLLKFYKFFWVINLSFMLVWRCFSHFADSKASTVFPHCFSLQF